MTSRCGRYDECRESSTVFLFLKPFEAETYFSSPQYDERQSPKIDIYSKFQSTEVLSASEVIDLLVRTIACNGNLLLNIGPTNHGMIPAIFEDRLSEVGQWVRRNSEAIFDTYPWMYLVSLPKGQRMKLNAAWTPHVEGSKLYAFFLEFPKTKTVTLPSVIYRRTIYAEVLLDETDREEIEVDGEQGQPVVLNFESHQNLAKTVMDAGSAENHSFTKVTLFSFRKFPRREANLAILQRDPIRHLKKIGVLDNDGHPRRTPPAKKDDGRTLSLRNGSLHVLNKWWFVCDFQVIYPAAFLPGIEGRVTHFCFGSKEL
uniref:alpha-L-fucosidase n=1 Tax=Parascaris equorum TaxID=6256 RepID=A0A914SIC1_PAREQ